MNIDTNPKVKFNDIFEKGCQEKCFSVLELFVGMNFLGEVNDLFW